MLTNVQLDSVFDTGVSTPSYDTVGLRLDCSDAERAVHALSNVVTRVFNNTDQLVHTGRLNNLNVKINASGISITGSFPKFVKGSNLFSLSLHQTRMVIEQLNRALGLPMEEARVYRIDFAANFFLSSQVSNYVCLLGECGLLQSSIHGKYETIRYKGNNRTLNLYDKFLEMKKHKSRIPSRLPSGNCLRYEISFDNRLSEQFKLKEVQALHLYSSGFYEQCANKWYKNYMAIHKARSVEVSSDVIKTRDLVRLLAAIQVKRLGEKLVMEMLSKSKQQRTKGQNARLRRTVVDLITTASTDNNSNLIDELDQKVMVAYEAAIEQSLEGS